MRLIDADATEKEIAFVRSLITSESEWLNGYISGLGAAIVAVVDAPTIEAEPVKHGRWEHIVDFGAGNCYGSCSNCHTDHKAQNRTFLISSYRYCRWCGAKMDGGADHEN